MTRPMTGQALPHGAVAVARADEAQPSFGSAFWMIMLASLGGGVEFYDFVSYGIYAASIAASFFPAQNETTSLVGSFAVLAVGYLVRPIGGIIFSHFGDRLGRPSTYLFSILGISLASMAMAFCPSYQTWGVWATIAFVSLRLLQGLCLGGEVPGAMTYIMEVAPPRHRALGCSLLFVCLGLGVVLADAVSAALQRVLPPGAAAGQLGWRLAFGIGGLIGLLSYLPRRRLRESPAFKLIRAQQEIARMPLLVLRHHLGRIATGIGLTAALAAYNGILFAYLPAYLIRVVHYPAATVASALAVGQAAGLLTVIFAGWLSDRTSPRAVLRFGAVVVLLSIWPFFHGFYNQTTVSLSLLLIGFAALGGILGGSFSPLVAELFPTRIRFSGVAVTYNLGFAAFSGLAPLSAATLIAATGNGTMPALYIAAAAAITLISTSVIRPSL